MEPWRHRETKETWRDIGDMEMGTWRHGNMKTWTWRHGNMENWRHGDTETTNGKQKMENRSPGDFP
jgi:hypothetical protein